MGKWVASGLVGLSLIIGAEIGIREKAWNYEFNYLEYKYQSSVLKSKGNHVKADELIKLADESRKESIKYFQLVEDYSPFINIKKCLKSL